MAGTADQTARDDTETPRPAAAGAPGSQAGGRPGPVNAVQPRRYGRWTAAAVVVYLLAALLWSLWHNANVNVPAIRHYLLSGLVLHGVWVTIELTIVAMIIGMAGGIPLAVMRLSKNPVLSALSWAYLWFSAAHRC